jgi:hypothetical protein
MVDFSHLWRLLSFSFSNVFLKSVRKEKLDGFGNVYISVLITNSAIDCFGNV